MSSNNHLIGIYDFEFFPYALGDVLTWNVRAAMRCDELNIHALDVYICIDEKNPASIYQRGLINQDNFELFFNELYSAFGTNPKLRNLYIFRQRDSLLAKLEEVKDEHNLEIIEDYLTILQKNGTEGRFSKFLATISKKTRVSPVVHKILKRFIPVSLKATFYDKFSQETILNNYFIKYIYSHENINAFFTQRGYIPFLTSALGCKPDIEELIARRFKGKKLVPFHLRLRQLDIGYGGAHTYGRDSDFLEWYDFLKKASIKYPEVQFVALGRLQEKPLAILRLPNVVSLRIYGLSLGHELCLMLKSDLFIGSSSGFAAFANFSTIPYFITRMNEGACKAYGIPFGAEKLPFANEQQLLIYKEESSTLLLSLLEKGLSLTASSEVVSSIKPLPAAQINLTEWIKLHSQAVNFARTTSRFYIDKKYRQEETAYLLLPSLEKARQAFIEQGSEKAKNILLQIQQHFPNLCDKLAHYLLLHGSIAIEEKNLASLQKCLAHLDSLVLNVAQEKTVKLFKAYLTGEFKEEPDSFSVSLTNKLKSQMKQFNFAEVCQ